VVPVVSEALPDLAPPVQIPIPAQPANGQPAVQAPTLQPPTAPRPSANPITVAPKDYALTITEVQITGVDAELQQMARQKLRTQAGRDTSRVLLEQDIAALLNTGLFADATVRSQTNAQGVAIIFALRPTVVRQVKLSNAEALNLGVATRIFQDQFGQSVSPGAIAQGVKLLNEWYAQNGYTLARVLTVDPSRDGTLTIDVAEGRVGEVQVRFVDKDGNRTDPATGRAISHRTQIGLLRQQVKLQSGQIFNVAQARTDLRNLAQLGVLENATVSFEGDANQTTVVYNVVEGKARGVNFSGGYNDTLGVYGGVNYQDRNFGGLGQRLSSNVQLGTKDFQVDTQFVSPYRETDPSTPGYSGNLSRREGISRVFDEKIKLTNGERVRERRIGGGVSLERPLGNNWQGSAGLNYTNISMRDGDGTVTPLDGLGNPLSFSGSGIDELFTLSFTAVNDKRDSFTNPSKGSLLTLSTEQSLPFGQGNLVGNRLQANYSEFIPVGFLKPQSKPGEQPEVVAFNVQGGTTLGDLAPANAYLLGGPSSVRGYGTGDLATSRSYFQASAEYRFPVYKFIGGVVFADFASDLGSSDNVLGSPGIARGNSGSGFGYGAGLRVNSPIGIIRADLGFNDQGENRFQVGFGQKF
jgi:outer membrane protein insertion porin family